MKKIELDERPTAYRDLHEALLCTTDWLGRLDQVLKGVLWGPDPLLDATTVLVKALMYWSDEYPDEARALEKRLLKSYPWAKWRREDEPKGAV